jgi:hypothetical protein
MMETKHWVYIAVAILLAIGILWLAKMLPGLGIGLGGGKGDGAGTGNGKSAEDKPGVVQPMFPAGSKGTAIVGRDSIELKVGDAPAHKVSLEEIEKWAAEGREIEIKRKKDVPDETVRRLQKLETDSKGKVYIGKGFVD